MDCKISPKNAITLDKLCLNIKSQYMVIDTRDGVKIQLVSDSKNIVSNINLNPSFFDECDLKNQVVKINKPRFSFSKMINLKIETTPSLIIFVYEFDDYIYRHRYVLFEASLYTIPYIINKSDYIEAYLLYQVICQIKGDAKIKFEGSQAQVYNESINVKFHCPGFSGISFVFDTEIFRRILCNYEMFDSCLLNWEDENSPVNINFYGTTLTAFYFVAT